MPWEIQWEPRGVYRRYFGDVTIAERRASFDAISAHRHFDEFRYVITDYLDVRGYEVTDEATREIAALHVGALITNPRIRIAAVAVRSDIVAAIEAFKSLGYTSQPYQVFSTLAEARRWAHGPGAGLDGGA